MQNFESELKKKTFDRQYRNNFRVLFQIKVKKRKMLTSFEYLICLDFEATCWEKRNPEKAEIVGNYFEFSIRSNR